jgi:hypothetical protein
VPFRGKDSGLTPHGRGLTGSRNREPLLRTACGLEEDDGSWGERVGRGIGPSKKYRYRPGVFRPKDSTSRKHRRAWQQCGTDYAGENRTSGHLIRRHATRLVRLRAILAGLAGSVSHHAGRPRHRHAGHRLDACPSRHRYREAMITTRNTRMAERTINRSYCRACRISSRPSRRRFAIFSPRDPTSAQPAE